VKDAVWNNLHIVRTRSKDLKAKQFKSFTSWRRAWYQTY